MKQEPGIAGTLAHIFLNSKLTPLFIAASLAIGAFAIAVIPRGRTEDPRSDAGHYHCDPGCIAG
jgi:hypothetical protein